jgi:hypothetical protein
MEIEKTIINMIGVNRPAKINKSPISVKKENPIKILRNIISSSSHISLSFLFLNKKNKD